MIRLAICLFLIGSFTGCVSNIDNLKVSKQRRPSHNTIHNQKISFEKSLKVLAQKTTVLSQTTPELANWAEHYNQKTRLDFEPTEVLVQEIRMSLLKFECIRPDTIIKNLQRRSVVFYCKIQKIPQGDLDYLTNINAKQIWSEDFPEPKYILNPVEDLGLKHDSILDVNNQYIVTFMPIKMENIFPKITEDNIQNVMHKVEDILNSLTYRYSVAYKLKNIKSQGFEQVLLKTLKPQGYYNEDWL